MTVEAMLSAVDPGVRHQGLAGGVLGCELPRAHRLRAVSLVRLGQEWLSASTWLGGDSNGSQLEAVGPIEGLEPSQMMLGGEVLGADGTSVIMQRFWIPRSDVEAVTRVLARAWCVGAIAVQATGLEALRDLQETIRLRLALLEVAA